MACPEPVLRRIVGMRRAGLTLRAIAEELNTDRVPTPAGRPRWYPSYVCRLLQRRAAQNLLGNGRTSGGG